MTEPVTRFQGPQEITDVVLATIDSGQKFIGWVSESREDVEIQAINDPIEVSVRPLPRLSDPSSPRQVELNFVNPDFEIPNSVALTTVVKFEYHSVGSKLFNLYFQARDSIGKETVQITAKRTAKEVQRQLDSNRPAVVSAGGQMR